MTRVERRLLHRVLRRALILLALATCLILFLAIRRFADKRGFPGDPVVVQAMAHFLLQSLSIAVVAVGPIATLFALLHLRREAILVPVLAAGLPARRLRRVLAIIALVTVVLAAVLAEAAGVLADAKRRRVRVWRSGTELVWAPQGNPRDELVLLRRTSREAWRGRVAADAAGATTPFLDAAPLRGSGAIPQAAITLPPPADALADRPLRDLFGARSSLHRRAAALNRILIPGALLLVCGYLALLIRGARRDLLVVAFLFLLPASAFATVGMSVVLWQGGAAGLIGQVALWLSLAACILGMDRAYERRGIRD